MGLATTDDGGAAVSPPVTEGSPFTETPGPGSGGFEARPTTITWTWRRLVGVACPRGGFDMREHLRKTRAVDPAQRVVTTLPLQELFDSKGAVRGLRGESLPASAIAALLSAGVRRFVVADVGMPLRWIANRDVFSFWKSQAKDRIVDPTVNKVFLDNYREGLAYFASRWRLDSGEDVIVLEATH